MSQDSLEDLWERIRDEIRKLRGSNRFRGNEVHLLPRKEIRLPVEARESILQKAEIIIHLHEAESEVWAVYHPGGARWTLQEFDMDLAAFISFLADKCRGSAYLHTNSKTADYRKQFLEDK
ncbi:MAG TPA: hypothetical protein ENJ82_06270 [Bacteroidetes bacterium]|nr:hypothetical protein [Bacteroidota bacterium]